MEMFTKIDTAGFYQYVLPSQTEVIETIFSLYPIHSGLFA
jgi:hypothetical protein